HAGPRGHGPQRMEGRRPEGGRQGDRDGQSGSQGSAVPVPAVDRVRGRQDLEPGQGHRAMKVASLALGLVIIAGGCGRQQAGGIPDLAGVWIPDPQGAEAWPAELPLTPAAREAMARFDPAEHDPTTFCMPLGTPRNMLQTEYPIEIAQTPQRVVIVVQPNLANAEVRRIHLDNPLPDEPDPSWFGTSRGRWEGA